jgi:Family of unknown function (DUF6399)
VSTHDATTPTSPATSPRYPRDTATLLLEDFRDQQLRCGISARQFAQQQQLPRSTLQAWLGRQRRLDLDPSVVRFFDSPAGLAFLQRLVAAAHLVFCLQGSAGLRLLSQFFRLCQLDRFVAASYGARQQFAALLEQGVLDFAAQQRQQLAQDMAPKAIAVAEDETYHPDICLVAIEPVSNFLLLEQYAEQRDAATWNAALQQALQGLPVTVVQTVSDEAKGLLAHAQVGLGVPHSPDLFHVQQEQSRGTAPVLAAQRRQAQRALQQAQQQQALAQQAQHQAQQQAAIGIRPAGRPLDHERRVQQAATAVADSQCRLALCEQRQEQARAAIRQLSAADHPFALDSGRAQGAPVVQQRLTAACAQLEALAEAAALPEGSRQRLAKARRVLPGLVAAVAFFWLRLRTAAQALGPEAWGWVERLTAGMYLRRVAGKLREAEARAELRMLAEQCLAEARSLGVEPPGGWEAAERLAWEWSGWFQRSSSCVEGRNGQLALRHHSLHKLSPRKLAALTALHNYWIQRGGQTAAERFFGKKPADLFEWLLVRLPLPARPARPRQKVA